MNYFKNEEKKPFNQCSDEEKLCIINVDCRERYGDEDDDWSKTWQVIYFSHAYRVLPPVLKPLTRDDVTELLFNTSGSTIEEVANEIFERGLSDGK